MRFLIWATPLLAIAAPAVAQQASPDTVAAPAAPAAPAAAKPKKVCRKFEVTGRRIASTQCYTAAQWAEYDRTQNEAANKLINDVSGTGARSSLSAGAGGSLSTGSVFGLGPQ